MVLHTDLHDWIRNSATYGKELLSWLFADFIEVQ